MWACGGCGHWIEDAATHCPKCGRKAPRRRRGSKAPRRRRGSKAPRRRRGSKAPRRKRTARKVTARRVVVALVLTAVVGLGGLLGYRRFGDTLGNDPPSALRDYMHGGGITYSFPGDLTSVRLPDAPKLEISTASVGGITVVIGRAAVVQKTYEMEFSEYAADVLRQGDPATIHQALEGGSNDVANRVGLSIRHTDDTPLDGRSARAVRGTVKGDQADLVMVYAAGNIYALFVHTNKGSAAVLKVFEASLQSG